MPHDQEQPPMKRVKVSDAPKHLTPQQRIQWALDRAKRLVGERGA